jgi:hypothetical protein
MQLAEQKQGAGNAKLQNQTLKFRCLMSASSASRWFTQAAGKGQFGFQPFLPDPMVGLVKIAAPQKLLFCEREEMLHKQ